MITIFGIIVMVNPFSTMKILLVMLGGGLLASGVFDLIADIAFSRKLKAGSEKKTDTL